MSIESTATVKVVKGKVTKETLRRIGRREGVIQIVPPRNVVRPSDLRESDHDLVSLPLASPTGPGGAAGFHNRSGSQIAVPEVTNIYLGPFWGDENFVEGFSKAIVENGYLDPLRDLGYGTGPGTYQGPIDGPPLASGTTFHDADAQAAVRSLIDQDGSQSCAQFCGYHDAFDYKGTTLAYAVLPSSLCQPCGGQIGDFTAVYAHELAEAVTDKVPGQGWVADDGEEDGDLEAWIFFGWGPPEDPSRYTVQGYYTNERGNTVGAW